MADKTNEGSLYFPYNNLEKPFIDYFDRCWDTDMSIGEIKKQLSYLEKYYRKIVLKEMSLKNYKSFGQPSLKRCFQEWSLMK